MIELDITVAHLHTWHWAPQLVCRAQWRRLVDVGQKIVVRIMLRKDRFTLLFETTKVWQRLQTEEIIEQ